MKTIVLVSLPGSVLGLDLSDFPAGGPLEGRTYEFDGKLYRVSEIIETLGSRSLLGTKINGDMRLLSFAETVSNGDAALKQNIIKPKPVGTAGPEDVRSKGGIIIGQTEEKKPTLDTLSSDAVHIVFVKAVPVESKSGAIRVAGVRLQAQTTSPREGGQTAEMRSFRP